MNFKAADVVDLFGMAPSLNTMRTTSIIYTSFRRQSLFLKAQGLRLIVVPCALKV